MKSTFVEGSVWGAITAASRRHKGPSDVAVAYFGKGATKLLRLSSGSRLVVDASEQSVKSGQTHPASLLALQRNGVRIFSVQNLHAKVFVFGRVAFVGSANASERSARHLFEAVVRTTDAAVVRDARDCIRRSCLDELRPKQLKKLQALYVPPKIHGGKKGERPHRSRHRSVSRCFIVQTETVELNNKEEKRIHNGKKLAKRAMSHPQVNRIDHFICEGRCCYQPGDLIVTVNKTESGRFWVHPPGRIVGMQDTSEDMGKRTDVYLELSPRPRRALATVVKSLGRGSKTKLLDDGPLKDRVFKERLLEAMNDDRRHRTGL